MRQSPSLSIGSYVRAGMLGARKCADRTGVGRRAGASAETLRNADGFHGVFGVEVGADALSVIGGENGAADDDLAVGTQGVKLPDGFLHGGDGGGH